MSLVLTPVRIDGIFTNFSPRFHIRAHSVHDTLERHSVLDEFRIRIETGIEQMIFVFRFDDRAGIAVQVLLTRTSVLQHFAFFFVVHEIACTDLKPRGSLSMNRFVLPPVMKIEQTEAAVFVKKNKVSYPSPVRLIKQVSQYL